jgi:serine/threonine protein kinase
MIKHSDDSNGHHENEKLFDPDNSPTSFENQNHSPNPSPEQPSDSNTYDANEDFDPDNDVTGTGIQETPFSLEAGKMFADRYRILNLIGVGGMGEVYRVEDTLDGRIVALKCIRMKIAAREDIQKRFIHEARICQKIAGWNVVRVYDVNRTGKLLYYTMEYLEGQTLGKRLDELRSLKQRMSLDEIRHLVVSICQGLEDAHRLTLHRDLKPENIFILQSGDVKLLDFGLARALQGSQLTQQTQRMGTPYYMAPEQFASTGKEPAASLDMYSLGVILYELLTLRIPMAGMEKASTIRHDIDSAMDEFIQKCLSADPEKRPQSAKEFKNGFLAALKGEMSQNGGPVQPVENETKPGTASVKRQPDQEKPVSQSRHKNGMMVAAVIIGAVILVFLFRDHLPFRQSGLSNDIASSAKIDQRSLTPAPVSAQDEKPPDSIAGSATEQKESSPAPVSQLQSPIMEDISTPAAARKASVPTTLPGHRAAVVKKNDNCVVFDIDYSRIPDNMNPRLELMLIKQDIEKRNWNVYLPDSNSLGGVSMSALGEKYACRYVLSGRLSVRDGDYSGDLFPGTGIRFAHALASLTFIDTESGAERLICNESVKSGHNTQQKAREKAMRELFEVVSPAIMQALQAQ